MYHSELKVIVKRRERCIVYTVAPAAKRLMHQLNLFSFLPSLPSARAPAGRLNCAPKDLLSCDHYLQSK